MQPVTSNFFSPGEYKKLDPRAMTVKLDLVEPNQEGRATVDPNSMRRKKADRISQGMNNTGIGSQLNQSQGKLEVSPLDISHDSAMLKQKLDDTRALIEFAKKRDSKVPLG